MADEVKKQTYQGKRKVFPNVPSYDAPKWVKATLSITGIALGTSMVISPSKPANYLVAGVLAGGLGYGYGKVLFNNRIVGAGVIGALGLGSLAMKDERLAPNIKYAMAGIIGGSFGYIFRGMYDNTPASVGIMSAIAIGSVAMRDKRLPSVVRYSLAGIIGASAGLFITEFIPLNDFTAQDIMGIEVNKILGIVGGSALWVSLLYLANKK